MILRCLISLKRHCKQDLANPITDLENVHGLVQFVEEQLGHLVDGKEPRGVPLDDGGVDEGLAGVPDAPEVIREADELLHLSVVLGPDLLDGGSELQRLLSG